MARAACLWIAAHFSATYAAAANEKTWLVALRTERGARDGDERDEAKPRPLASRFLEFACGQFRRDRPHRVGNDSRREASGLSLGGQFAETLKE